MGVSAQRLVFLEDHLVGVMRHTLNRSLVEALLRIMVPSTGESVHVAQDDVSRKDQLVMAKQFRVELWF